MVDIGLDEAPLLGQGGVECGVTGVGTDRIMVVVRPLRKVIRKLVASRVGARVLKVNDDQLLVLVGGPQQRGLVIVWLDA